MPGQTLGDAWLYIHSGMWWDGVSGKYRNVAVSDKRGAMASNAGDKKVRGRVT